MARAQAVTVIDEGRARVTTWTFAKPGDETEYHTHQYDYLVVPVTGGTFTVTDRDGQSRTLVQRAGEPYAGAAGTAHNVVSSSDAAITFVEIELTQPAPRSAS